MIGLAVAAGGFAPTYEALGEPEDRAPGLITIHLGKGAEISGIVVSATGQRLDSVQVGYWSDVGRGAIPLMPRLISDAVSPNAAGEYVLPNVPSGPILVGIVREAGRLGARFQDLHRTECHPGDFRTIDFVLDEYHSISGRFVAESRPGSPLVVASLLNSGSVPLAVTETRMGAEFLIDNIAPGAYVLRASVSERRFVDLELRVDGPLELGEVSLESLYSR